MEQTQWHLRGGPKRRVWKAQLGWLGGRHVKKQDVAERGRGVKTERGERKKKKNGLCSDRVVGDFKRGNI